MSMQIRSSLFIPTIFSTLIISSCGPSRTVSFNVTRPAEITLPSEVNTILLVDRTKLSNETLNTIEGILTGEMPGDDKAAAQEAMMSLKNSLDNSPRFNVKILPDRLEGNSLTAAFPQALGWDIIDKLCKNNQTEIVICLEVFDSDFIVTNGSRIKKKTLGEATNKREVDYTEYYAQGVGSVKIGIRAYNNLNKTITDQQMIEKNNTWESTGQTPVDALALLISKSNANKYLSAGVGEDYAYKISPMPVRISRAFYGKSKHAPELETGSRYADVNQWDEAIDEWKKGLASARKKEAGYLAYNIAIAYEVLGEYGTALTWAQDSYTKYGNKNGRNYVQSLRRRINEEAILKRQMDH
jgi:tetratricopeptide (TPR) repeat protein